MQQSKEQNEQNEVENNLYGQNQQIILSHQFSDFNNLVQISLNQLRDQHYYQGDQTCETSFEMDKTSQSAGRREQHTIVSNQRMLLLQDRITTLEKDVTQIKTQMSKLINGFNNLCDKFDQQSAKFDQQSAKFDEQSAKFDQHRIQCAEWKQLINERLFNIQSQIMLKNEKGSQKFFDSQIQGKKDKIENDKQVLLYKLQKTRGLHQTTQQTTKNFESWTKLLSGNQEIFNKIHKTYKKLKIPSQLVIQSFGYVIILWDNVKNQNQKIYILAAVLFNLCQNKNIQTSHNLLTFYCPNYQQSQFSKSIVEIGQQIRKQECKKHSFKNLIMKFMQSLSVKVKGIQNSRFYDKLNQTCIASATINKRVIKSAQFIPAIIIRSFVQADDIYCNQVFESVNNILIQKLSPNLLKLQQTIIAISYSQLKDTELE